MRSVKEIYQEIILKGKYDEEYASKAIEKDGYMLGDCIDFSKKLLEQIKEEGYESHIISTKNPDGFLHAAVVYKDNNQIYIADPVTDIKRYTDMNLDINQRKEEVEETKNYNLDVDEYIKENGEISLYNVNMALAAENINTHYELEGKLRDSLLYNIYGFNREGLYIFTGERYDEEGFDKYGFDRKGILDKRLKAMRGRYTEYRFDEEGWDIYKETYIKSGRAFDDKGYNRNGIDKRGFDKNGIHKNGTRYNETGYDVDGYNEQGFNTKGIHRNGTNYDDDGYNDLGIDKTGHNKAGFNKKGIHKNGTRYDQDGYDIEGYNKKGFNRDGFNYGGFNNQGIHKNGTKYDEDGFDVEGYNEKGFNRFYKFRNGSLYDENGLDYRGRDKKGFYQDGSHHVTKKEYNMDGYDKDGNYFYDSEGYDFQGYNKEGYDRNGYDRRGFNNQGIHINGTQYDENGYNIEGYNLQGFDRQNIDKEGYDRQGYNKFNVNREGINRITGEIDSRIVLIREYIQSNTSREKYCVKNNIELSQFNQILNDIFEIFPSIEITKKDLEETAHKSSAIYLAKRQKIAENLLSKELSFEEYAKDPQGIIVKDLLDVLKETKDEEKICKIICNGIIGKEFDMMDYIKILIKGKYDNQVYNKTMSEFRNFESIVKKYPSMKKEYIDLRKEEKRLNQFKNPFDRRKCSEKVGVLDSETNKVKYVEITEEHIRYAKQHLINKGKYICSKSMENVFSKFAKGELTFEEIENEKRKDCNLAQLDNQLTEQEEERNKYKDIENIINKIENRKNTK